MCVVEEVDSGLSVRLRGTPVELEMVAAAVLKCVVQQGASAERVLQLLSTVEVTSSARPAAVRD